MTAGWMIKDPYLIPSGEWDPFFTIFSTTLLRPFQLSFQWIIKAIFVGKKRPKLKAEYTPQSSAEVNELHCQICVCLFEIIIN
jgi:hypothetical protein